MAILLVVMMGVVLAVIVMIVVPRWVVMMALLRRSAHRPRRTRRSMDRVTRRVCMTQSVPVASFLVLSLTHLLPRGHHGQRLPMRVVLTAVGTLRAWAPRALRSSTRLRTRVSRA